MNMSTSKCQTQTLLHTLRRKRKLKEKHVRESSYIPMARNIGPWRGEQRVRLCELRAQCPFYTYEEIAAIRRAKAAFTRRFSSSFVRSIGNAAIDRCDPARTRASVEARTSLRALPFLCFYTNLVPLFKKLIYISALSLRRSYPTSSWLSRWVP